MLSASLLFFMFMNMSAFLADLDARIEEAFKGRSERLAGELHDLILREIGHDGRRRRAVARGTERAAREASRRVRPGVSMNLKLDQGDAEDVFRDMVGARVVFLAESHDHPAHHELQLRAVKWLDTGGDKLAVGLEMFPREIQPVLDRWNAGELSEWDFLEGVNWYRMWGFPYALFRPLFLYCRDHEVALVGLNAPAEVNRKVGRGGLASITPEERARLARDIDLTDARHRRNFEEIMPHHPGMKIDFFYEAFCAWDDTMAESAADWLKSHGGRMLVIAGSGHIRRGRGIPDRLKKRFPVETRIVLPWDVGTEEENYDVLLEPGADWIWWTEEAHQPPPPRVGISTDPALKVTTVAPGSAAEKAGVRVGDVLRRAGKRDLKTTESLRHYLEIRKSDEFTLRVERDGAEVALKIALPR
jgi:uncharacterized iron-regulated protein